MIARDLFEAAGIELDASPAKPKRHRRLNPAAQAAAARAHGARRPQCPCADGSRIRIGGPRDLSPKKIFGFPMSRNAELVAQIVKQLPHVYAKNWDIRRAAVCKNVEQKLLFRGIPEDEALWCANELVHAAFNVRVTEAHREMGIA